MNKSRRSFLKLAPIAAGVALAIPSILLTQRKPVPPRIIKNVELYEVSVNGPMFPPTHVNCRCISVIGPFRANFSDVI